MSDDLQSEYAEGSRAGAVLGVCFFVACVLLTTGLVWWLAARAL